MICEQISKQKKDRQIHLLKNIQKVKVIKK